MKHGSDASIDLGELIVVHQNLPKRVVASHSHDMHEIILPLAGKIKVAPTEGNAVNAQRGEMVLIPASITHSYEVKGADAEQVIVLFSTKWLEESPLHPTLLQHSVLIAELAILLLLEGTEVNRSPVIATLQLAIRRSLGFAAHNTPTADLRIKASDERLRKALAYMEANLAAEEVLAGAAKAAAASERTLARLCKTDLGLTPGDLLRTLRMSHAQKLLAAGTYSVTEVALDCGYSSMSQFINNFRDATGTLPSQFRKK